MKKKGLSMIVMVAVMLIATMGLAACAEQDTTSSPIPASPTASATASTTASATTAVATTAPTSVKPIELKLGYEYGPTQAQGQAVSAWIEKVKTDTNGRLIITPYWNSTLLSPKEALAELIKGAADIGEFNQNNFPQDFQLYNSMAYFLHGCPDAETAKKICLQAYQTVPELAAEVDKVKYLATVSFPYYDLMSKRPVRQLADLKGIAIRVPGMFIDTFKAAGASPVALPVGEVSISLEKGIIDGTVGCLDTLKANQFADLVDYVTYLKLVIPPKLTMGMNKDSYNRLPADIKKIFDDSLPFLEKESEKALQVAWQNGIDYAKGLGLEFIDMPSSELQQLYGYTEATATKKAADLDAKGLAGTKLYNEIQRLIKEYSK